MNLITKTRLAQIAGVTPAAITKACGKQIKDAIKGKRIDAGHPSVIAYLASRGNPAPKAKPRGHAAKNARRKRESLSAINETPLNEIPEDITEFAGMTLTELIRRFGTEYAFVDWLKAVKHIEDIAEKRLKNAQTAGELVHRDLVKRGILEPIDSAHLKLLTDGSKTLARRVTALYDSGETVEAIEKYISGQISSFIKPVKHKIKRILSGV